MEALTLSDYLVAFSTLIQINSFYQYAFRDLPVMNGWRQLILLNSEFNLSVFYNPSSKCVGTLCECK